MLAGGLSHFSQNNIRGKKLSQEVCRLYAFQARLLAEGWRILQVKTTVKYMYSSNLSKGGQEQLEDSQSNSSECGMRTICLTQWKTKPFWHFLLQWTCKERKACKIRLKCNTHSYKHTQPNLSHISLTLLSEDVYRLARDLFPIWQSQEHLNGFWKKGPTEFFHMDIC